jgi:site-specific recombinase XerD
MEEKKDIHKIEQRYFTALKSIEKDRNITKENKEIILRFLRDCELGKTIKGKQKKKIGRGRLLRVSSILKTMSNDWFRKPFTKITQQDMENFISDLERRKILSHKGKPYTEETQVTIKKFIKKFYKWLLGESIRYPELVDWIDTSGKQAEIPALRKQEIEKLLERTSNVRDKAMIILLFDSGARIEEFLNLRLDDVKVRKEGINEFQLYNVELGEKDYFKIRIRYSKSKRRTIGIPLCTKYLKEWLKEHPKMNDPSAFLFDLTYPNIKKILMRKGMKILNKRLTPHILRHSSMTYYANIIKNRYQLCYRYGLAMSSKVVDRYIDRSGIIEEETADAVKADEITRFKKNYEKFKEKLDNLDEKYERTQEMLQRLLLDVVISRETIKKDPKFRKAYKETIREFASKDQISASL